MGISASWLIIARLLELAFMRNRQPAIIVTALPAAPAVVASTADRIPTHDPSVPVGDLVACAGQAAGLRSSLPPKLRLA